jgi:hypothetical protein
MFPIVIFVYTALSEEVASHSPRHNAKLDVTDRAKASQRARIDLMIAISTKSRGILIPAVIHC